jgi:hypothetical protein
VILSAVAGVAEARSQMGITLAFHIVFACFGVALPAIVMLAHFRGLRHHYADALLLARRWSKVMAVLVAVGAVSGTLLSFEMGLLWPGLMGKFGSAIGIPFSIEGIFFLLEAVFVAIYLFGWDRLSPWWHFWSLAPVTVSGILGAWSVVAANSWMNQPSGFALSHGHVYRIDPFAVFFNNASWYEVPPPQDRLVDDEQAARLELRDVAVDRARRRDAAELEVRRERRRVERCRVDLARPGRRGEVRVCPERLQLGGEHQRAGEKSIVERLLAEAVPCQREPPLGPVEERERKHAFCAGERDLDAPGFDGREQDLGV